jgi:HAD superfamily hydrolase (TIGR01549 family)
MIKAIFFDMDETLCATEQANQVALSFLAKQLTEQWPKMNVDQFCARYLSGVYKQLNDEFPQLVPLLSDEMAFRCALIVVLFSEQGIVLSLDTAKEMQLAFDGVRMSAFDFYPALESLVKTLRKHVKVGVITNGPTFSQLPKIDAIKLREKVDFVLVGGEEPEEKPALSIFEKALYLANCQANEAIHVGDSLRCDIGGAMMAGIDSVWVDSQRATDHQALDEGKFTPTWRVNHASQLPDILLPLVS